MELSPILIFTYKRLKPLKKTIEALQNNKLAKYSMLYIFSDGPKNQKDILQIEEVRNFIKNINGFKRVILNESTVNKGLAKSIINGVTEILVKHETVIVLEDDLITSSNFLNFMNQSLEEFRENPKVMSVSGYTVPIKLPKDYKYDNYYTKRASSWGWATWKNRWEPVDWNVSDYHEFSVNVRHRKKFNEMGSDMSHMLAKQMNGKISSWAIRWCYHQFKHDLYTVFPIVSKISNIGFDEGATHTFGAQDRYATTLDNSEKEHFNFNHNVELNEWFIKQFVSKYSIKTRVYYKIKKVLGI